MRAVMLALLGHETARFLANCGVIHVAQGLAHKPENAEPLPHVDWRRGLIPPDTAPASRAAQSPPLGAGVGSE